MRSDNYCVTDESHPRGGSGEALISAIYGLPSHFDTNSNQNRNPLSLCRPSRTGSFPKQNIIKNKSPKIIILPHVSTQNQLGGPTRAQPRVTHRSRRLSRGGCPLAASRTQPPLETRCATSLCTIFMNPIDFGVDKTMLECEDPNRSTHIEPYPHCLIHIAFSVPLRLLLSCHRR